MKNLGTLQVEAESAVVIYDVHTGQIVHRHEVVTLKGGKHPDKQTQERDAHEQLLRIVPDFKGETAMLHVNPADIKPRVVYKVDLAKRVLVEQVRPIRRK
jgi:hypothetical protein